MLLDQTLRRWTNRLRRKVIRPVDHEPIVTLETPGGAQRLDNPRPNWAYRARRFARSAFAFGATGAALAAVYVMFMAIQAQIAPDWGPLRARPPDGLASLAMAEEVLVGAQGPTAFEQDVLFLPSGRRGRALQFQLGAAEAATGLATAIADQPPADPAWSAVAAPWPGSDRSAPPDIAERLTAARLAIARWNEASDLDRLAFARIVDAANASLTLAEADLARVAAAARAGPLHPAAEAAFFRARGRAYGWRLLLERAADDLGLENRAGLEAALSPVLASLEAAAAYQPLFLFNGPTDAWITPNHMTTLHRRVGLAKARLSVLGAAVLADR